MGSTPLGIRYPDLDSAAIATDIQNTMSDIDALGVQVAAAAATIRARDGFQLKGGTWTGASGAGANASFTTVRWDTGTHWAIGSPTVIAFDAGYWLISGTMTFTASAGNITWAYIRMVGVGGGTVMQQQIYTTAVNLVQLEGMVVIQVPNAGLNTALEFAAATSGGANYTADSYRFIAHRLRPL